MVRAQADALVSSGMCDAGYVYVNIDGGWQCESDTAGVLHPKATFSGMKALSDLRSLEGSEIWPLDGAEVLRRHEASYGHEAQDAKMFAFWDVDFLKYNLCTFHDIMKRESGSDVKKSEGLMRAAYKKMHGHLLETGRPMVFSMCQYGSAKVWEWGRAWAKPGSITYAQDTKLSFTIRKWS